MRIWLGASGHLHLSCGQPQVQLSSRRMSRCRSGIFGDPVSAAQTRVTRALIYRQSETTNLMTRAGYRSESFRSWREGTAVLENVPLDWRSGAVDDTVQGLLPPRGFRLKTSMAGVQYWPEVWATPALAPKRSAGASVAAAWREQLGDGEAGQGRLPRGRAAQVGHVDWG